MAIEARGIRHNNLVDLDVDLPLNRVVVITGVSGSGKSSLAMGTLFAEGRQRFLEGLSTFSRRRISQAQRPDVDLIAHLPAALALRQRPPVPGPRSTVGTMSSVFNALRLSMSRLGSHQCPNGHTVAAGVHNFSEEMDCPTCGVRFMVPGAESFAFNSEGACPQCAGVGERFEVKVDRLIPDPSLTIEGGAVLPWNVGGMRLSRFAVAQLGVRTDVPWSELTAQERDIVFHGEPVVRRVQVAERAGKPVNLNVNYENAIAAVERQARSDNAGTRKRQEQFLDWDTCSLCHGSRLRPEALTSTLDGMNLADINAFTLEALGQFVRRISPNAPAELRKPADTLARETLNLIDPLVQLGLGYLSLDRAGSTLSTGERQRLELTSTVQANTTGMLYVLDEPSVGLHPSNVVGLIATIRSLVDGGNSVVMVEHDVDVITEADWIVELGPGAGSGGGRIIAQGTPEQVRSDAASIIGPFLSGGAAVERTRRPIDGEQVAMHVADLHNLHDVSLQFPTGALTAVAGPSGAGKTALILESLIPGIKAALDGVKPPAHITHLETPGIRALAEIDATPIGSNSRSTPATYSGVHDAIRAVFAAAPLSKERGWGATQFSYNTKQGQCPVCTGLGYLDFDAQYLPDIRETCPECHGTRYAHEVLEVTVDGLTIADVLSLTVHDALDRLATWPGVERPLRPIDDVGLGYLRLGEATPSLSGGEAQRLRIATRLRTSQKGVLYVFDEPSTGLHPLDVRTLVSVFDRLIDDGATVVVIDHDLDVLAAADYLIDMGPVGGPEGGQIVAQGRPDDVARDPMSTTGRFLLAHLARSGDVPITGITES
ncbi:excinuclease ABC subunit UvrA [Agreia sp. PsM10]|uniref:excinuclease ABC subunit UvrA n=1 Tax=Agreia sp. PsM10 TaxID=3030533 RepID=UPI00263B2113|nr:excinuclease ABC subunit UvrA [Agreia sp. PsM10]MDN4640052.1 excinuclease ABC subunit UvrA [Agreia sp. PsM10]